MADGAALLGVLLLVADDRAGRAGDGRVPPPARVFCDVDDDDDDDDDAEGPNNSSGNGGMLGENNKADDEDDAEAVGARAGEARIGDLAAVLVVVVAVGGDGCGEGA